MSDHLPECLPHIVIPHGMVACICDRLRACEQRVRAEDDASVVAAAKADALNQLLDAGEVGLNAAYAKGVQAARDAVAAKRGWKHGMETAIYKHVALAAIDALKGEANV